MEEGNRQIFERETGRLAISCLISNSKWICQWFPKNQETAKYDLRFTNIKHITGLESLLLTFIAKVDELIPVPFQMFSFNLPGSEVPTSIRDSLEVSLGKSVLLAVKDRLELRKTIAEFQKQLANQFYDRQALLMIIQFKAGSEAQLSLTDYTALHTSQY